MRSDKAADTFRQDGRRGTGRVRTRAVDAFERGGELILHTRQLYLVSERYYINIALTTPTKSIHWESKA